MVDEEVCLDHCVVVTCAAGFAAALVCGVDLTGIKFRIGTI